MSNRDGAPAARFRCPTLISSGECFIPAYRRLPRLLPSIFFICILAACAVAVRPAFNVHLRLDGTSRELEISSSSSRPAPATVRATLRELGVELGELDQVEPPLWTPLRAGLHITVTRVLEEREERAIPFTMRLLRDEFLSPQESRVLEQGINGLEELVYRLYFDGPAILRRELATRCVVIQPREEVRLIGTQGTIPSMPISGTLAYIANGDAWVMRGESGQKRPLTEGGLLDGRVFDLSPDGKTLLYTAIPTTTQAGVATLNELWLMQTDVFNARPQPAGLRDVLWAAWAPNGARFAYSSASPTQGTPGWRAHNDLHIVAWPGLTATHVLSPTSDFIYAWWGETWAWSPDGGALAYARADQVGLLKLPSAETADRPTRLPLATFLPFHTRGDWVWLPTLTWSPDGQGLVAIIHEGDEDEARFALWRLDIRSKQTTPLALAAIGPWSGPAWSPAGDVLVYGVSTAPGQVVANYQLFVTEREQWDRAAPALPTDSSAVGYVQIAWAPQGQQFALVRDGDVWLYDLAQGQAAPLTASGLASHPRWR